MHFLMTWIVESSWQVVVKVEDVEEVQLAVVVPGAVVVLDDGREPLHTRERHCDLVGVDLVERKVREGVRVLLDELDRLDAHVADLLEDVGRLVAYEGLA